MNNPIYKSGFIDDLIANGELAAATLELKKLLFEYNDKPDIELSIRADLTILMIRQSRYQEAFEEAKILEQLSSLPQSPFFVSLIIGCVLSLTSYFNLYLVSRRLKNVISWLISFDASKTDNSVLNAILWGTYWQNMRRALTLNNLLVLQASSHEEASRGIAFLNYTLAYMGYGYIGVTGLRKEISRAVQIRNIKLEKELLVWLGVVEQMNANPQECFKIHKRLADRFPDADPFDQTISLASQLNTTVAELGPSETAVEVDRCFSGSFALKANRNHIQIYGAKASLLALEGRREESKSILEKSRETADSNSNSLDFLIFHRLAAITYINMQSPRLALDHVAFARTFMKKYCWVMWYAHELNRIELVALVQLNSYTTRRIKYGLRFLIGSFWFPSFRLFRKTLKIAFRGVALPYPTYWRDRDVLVYLRNRTEYLSKISHNTNLEKITLRLTQTVLSSDLSKAEIPGPDELKKEISLIFEGAEVILGKSLNACLSVIRDEYGLSRNFILNEINGSVRAVCKEGRYFIGISMSNILTGDDFNACGVLLNQTNMVEHEAVEMALRVIGAIYISNRLKGQSNEERIRNQKRVALSHLAAQVAHDIRSPLSALSILASFANELSDEKRALMRDATRRINDIANSLLIQSKAVETMQTASNEAAMPLQAEIASVSRMLDSIISEKRLQYRNASAIQILPPSSYPYGLFCSLSASEFKRMLSNLINNAVEAIQNKGTVTINIEVNHGLFTITVNDDGCGMPEIILNSLGIQNFTQGKSGKESGYGLGLPHAFATARNARGELKFESKVGIGTTAILTLPTHQPPTWHLRELALCRNAALIVVDDEPSIHEAWRRRFSRTEISRHMFHFLSIIQFEDAFAELKNLYANQFMILMDFEFSNMAENGLEAIARLSVSEHAVLVTSRCEEQSILTYANKLKIPILSKVDIAVIPVRIHEFDALKQIAQSSR